MALAAYGAGTVVAGPEAVQVAQVTARPAPVPSIFKAREEANWEKNTDDKNLPKNWWDRTSTWTSEDGKVTFAVGRGQSRDLNLAREKAALDARVRLIRRDTTAPVVSGGLVGSQVIRYKQEEEGMGYRAYCVVAVPTALLPRP